MGISVLMSVYARENPEFFKQAMKSIIQQTRQPDEILLIKDGPLTEELEKAIEEIHQKLADEKSAIEFRTYQFEENVQLGRALRKGVELCKHEFIARMDTDDISLPDRLELQYNYMMEHEKIAIVGGYIEEFCEETGETSIRNTPVGMDAIRSYARFRNPLNHVTVMFRKSAVLEAGNYRHYPYFEDYDLWSRVLAAGYEVDSIPEIMVRVRVGTEMYGRRGGAAYCKTALSLRKEQHKLGITNTLEYLIACCISISITLVPNSLRKTIYQTLLRK